MRKTILALLLAAAASQTALAQYGAFDMGVLGMNGAIDQATRQARDQARGRSGANTAMQSLSRSLAAQTRSAQAQRAVPVEASYRPSTTVRREIADIMARESENRQAGTGEEMRELVTSGRALSEYRPVAAALGYSRNDAVDALAFYLLAQWGVANDYRANISRQQAAAVRRQAANAYSGIADQIGSDAQRQEFAEMLIVQGVILAGTHEAAVRNGDKAALRRYAALARKGGRMIFTMDPTRIRLTNAGFRSK